MFSFEHVRMDAEGSGMLPPLPSPFWGWEQDPLYQRRNEHEDMILHSGPEAPDKGDSRN